MGVNREPITGAEEMLRRATQYSFRTSESSFSPLSQAIFHVFVGLVLVVSPMWWFATLTPENAQNMEMVIFFVSFTGMTYLTFAIRSWVLLVWADELRGGVYVDPTTGKIQSFKILGPAPKFGVKISLQKPQK